jgi:hypothetical protein
MDIREEFMDYLDTRKDVGFGQRIDPLAILGLFDTYEDQLAKEIGNGDQKEVVFSQFIDRVCPK